MFWAFFTSWNSIRRSYRRKRIRKERPYRWKCLYSRSFLYVSVIFIDRAEIL